MELSPTIIAIIVAAIVIVALAVFLAGRSGSKRKQEQLVEDRHRAEEIRRDADRDQVALREEELHAHEQELDAERARVEAEKARIDADRLEGEAKERRGHVDEARSDLDSRLREAEELDPDRRDDGAIRHDAHELADDVDDRRDPR